MYYLKLIPLMNPPAPASLPACSDHWMKPPRHMPVSHLPLPALTQTFSLPIRPRIPHLRHCHLSVQTDCLPRISLAPDYITFHQHCSQGTPEEPLLPPPMRFSPLLWTVPLSALPYHNLLPPCSLPLLDPAVPDFCCLGYPGSEASSFPYPGGRQ